MSMFDLKGNSSGWNYHTPDAPGYMEMIEGTVVEISNPQSINFHTKQLETWPDGNPKRNLRLIIHGRSGQELAWTFSPKSKGAEACLAALDPQGMREQVSIEELLGKFVRVQTQQGQFGPQNPRPWWVTILGDGEANVVRGLKDLSQPQGQVPGVPAPAPAPQVQQTPPPPVSQQQAPAPSMPPVEIAMSGGAGLPMATPNNAYPTQFQVAQQAAQQAVANQNFQQAAPPVNQVPVDAYGADPTGGYYDADIPF